MTADSRVKLAANRRAALRVAYLAVLVLAVGVPEVVHLHGSAPPAGVASQSVPSPASYYDAAGRQVLSV